MFSKTYAKQTFSADELPRVIDIFNAMRTQENKSQYKHFIRELHHRYAQLATIENEKPRKKKKVKALFEKTIDQANKLVAKSEIYDTDHVLLPYLSFEDTGCEDALTYELMVTSNLYHINDLPEYERIWSHDKPVIFWSDADRDNHDWHDYEAYPHNGYAYEFSPWDEILNYRVWCPPNMPEKMRNQFYADIWWEMTFFGYDCESHDQRTDEIIEQLDEATQSADEAKPLDLNSLRETLGTTTSNYCLDYSDYNIDLECAVTYNMSLRNTRTLTDFASRIEPKVDAA